MTKESTIQTSEPEARIMPAPWRWLLQVHPGLAWNGLIGWRIARCWLLLALWTPRLLASNIKVNLDHESRPGAI